MLIDEIKIKNNLNEDHISVSFVLLIKAVILRANWCHLKEASIATKRNIKINNELDLYIKVPIINYSVLKIQMSKVCFNHLNGRI